jgi:uncharacterized membrane protein YeiH
MVPLTEIDPNSAPVRSLMLILDLCGTFAFALSGAIAGVRRRLDIYGVLVAAFVTSSFGGIGRDLLIAAVPPAALVDWRYLAVSLAAGLIVFFWSSLIERLRSPVRLLDAAGLAFFCIAGTEKALAFGLSPVMAALLGMLTGIGGGIVRDVLLAEIPTVLRSDLYALAAACRRRSGGRWRAPSVSIRRHRDRWRTCLFWSPHHCDPTRVASAGCPPEPSAISRRNLRVTPALPIPIRWDVTPAEGR